VKNPFLLGHNATLLLSGLLEKRWDHWGTASSNPSPDGALVRFFIRTEDTFTGVSVDESGPLISVDDPDLTVLTIDRDNWDEVRAKRVGGLFFHDRGKAIKDIYVIRDYESTKELNSPEVTTAFDVGFVVEFNEGVIAFHRVDAYDLYFDVVRASSLLDLHLRPTSGRFISSLENQVNYTRTLIRLEELGREDFFE